MGCKPVREEYKRKLLQFICYTGTVDELNKLAEAVGKPRGRITIYIFSIKFMTFF